MLKRRCPDRGSLSIDEVNKDLDAIAANNASKTGKDIVRRHLMHLVTSLSAIEQKWLIRMVMKELKMGLSQTSVLGVYHPDAEELYNVNNNLEKVRLTSFNSRNLALRSCPHCALKSLGFLTHPLSLRFQACWMNLLFFKQIVLKNNTN